MSLHQAIANARIHQTRLLLDIGTNPNIPDRNSRTPLMLACFIEKESISVKIARMLLDKGAKFGVLDRYGRLALSYACMNGRDRIVQILLQDLEYDVNLPDEAGNTPLMYAAMSGNATAIRHVLKVLLKYHLSVDMRNNKGFSAYLLAAKMGHFYCAHILKTEGYASDGIRDTEYFLSDKEWVRRTRKELEKMQITEHRERTSSGLRSNHVSSRLSGCERPQTSLDFRPKSQASPQMRPVSRLTTQSEPLNFKYTPRLNMAENRTVSRASSGSSVDMLGNSVIGYAESSEITEIPSVVRTKTPDLHAIFSQYLSEAAFRPVKITHYDLVKDREEKFADEPEAVKMKEGGLTAGHRSRKQSRVKKKSVHNK